MDAADRKRLSKLLSLALRHRPEAIGITLDARGCTPIEPLLAAAARELGFAVTRAHLEQLAAAPTRPGEKRRFEIEGDFIRAGHGHSVPVDGLRPAEPEGPLFHATTRRAVAAIRRDGLRPMARQKVHLSSDRAITIEAASRRGRDTVLIEVDVPGARAAGVLFYESADGRVVLSDAIPPAFLRFEDGAPGRS